MLVFEIVIAILLGGRNLAAIAQQVVSPVIAAIRGIDSQKLEPAPPTSGS